MDPIKGITKPFLLYSRSAVLAKPCPVPAEPGLYGWFFKEIPGNTPTEGCASLDDMTLLYVGISPRNRNSKRNLRERIVRSHFRGNASGSTLRRSLGILLTDWSGFPLRRVGSGKRMTFTHAGEQWLDAWMEENAFVCWIEQSTPWELEREILGSVSLPLNIRDNQHHPFSSELSKIRRNAIRLAKESPIAREDNQRRLAGSTISLS